MAQGDEDDRTPAELPNDPSDISGRRGSEPNGGDDPQDFVLYRELTEIYLLLDNISTNPETTISALALRQDKPQGLEEDWIDQVTGVSWPPPNSRLEQAKQASLLIRVKDYLNRLAKPASGLTIAFTHLVTQEDDFERPTVDRSKPVCLDSTLSRGGLACIAYPDLYDTALRFRRVQWRINWVLVIWLVATCFLSWWVAYGNDSLREFKAATEQFQLAQQRVDDGEAGRTRAVETPKGDSDDAGDDSNQPKVESPPIVGAAPAILVEEVGYCDRWRLRVPKDDERAPNLPRWESAEQRQACLGLAQSERQVRHAEQRLYEWLGPICRFLLGVSKEEGDASSTAARLTAVLGGAVLPILYGFLGAGAAILRSVSRKIKSSTLSPRDLSLLLQQLALGAVVGACIGLFIGQPGEGESLIGPVALSASAISFVAGFGVDSVFQALEALISRIFNIAPAGGQPEPK